MVEINLKNLTKKFGGKREVIAVDNINLKIKDRSFITLLGPSGCGKTTTLRMIAGLEEPTKGEIYFDDELVNDIPTQKRNLAMVFQQPTLFPFMNVMDNITYGLKIRGVPKEERGKLAKDAAQILHIERLLDRKPSELSGGERQRVDLCRAIVTRPRVFLLDEPLASLDARLREQLRAEVRKVHKKLEVTTIFVTHDQLEAMTMSDEIAAMNNGKIEQVGAPKQLFDEPANFFVASFIGSPPMIFFDGNMIKDGAAIDTEYFSLEISKLTDEKIFDEISISDVKIGIRPDSLELLKKYDRDQFQGKIIMIEPLGNRWIFHLDVEGKEIKVELAGDHDFTEGETVNLKLDRESIHVFDGKTGKRLEIKF